MDASVATLKSMEAELNAVVKELREKQIGDVVVQNKNCIKYVKEFLIRKQSDMEDFTEVRVAVVGNVDAG
jgi:GTPase